MLLLERIFEPPHRTGFVSPAEEYLDPHISALADHSLHIGSCQDEAVGDVQMIRFGEPILILEFLR